MSVPTRIPADWHPTSPPEKFKHLFPDVDARAALTDFIAHHTHLGTRSHDWNAAFHGWCAGRQHRTNEKKRDTKQTDSMGLPLDGHQRATMHVTTEGDYGTRFLNRLNEHLKDDVDWDTAYQRTIADLEGEPS